MIRKLSIYMRTEELKTLYFAHFHSILMYGILVWGTLINKTKLAKIYRLQKQAIQSVHKLKSWEHCMPAFKSMKILVLSDQIELECIKFMYQINSNQVPTPVVNAFCYPSHSYMTCHKGPQNIRHTLTLVNQSYLNRAPMLWQNCNSCLKSKTSVFSLKKVVKESYLKKY